MGAPDSNVIRGITERGTADRGLNRSKKKTSLRPIALTPSQVARYGYTPGLKARLGALVAQDIEAGQIYNDDRKNGRRFVLNASSSAILYYQVDGPEDLKGRVFHQATEGFKEDIRTSAIPVGVAGAEGTARVMQAVVEVLIGALSIVSGFGAVVVIGTDILRFATENGPLLYKMHRAMSLYLDVRKFLKKNAPTVNDKLCDVLVSALWRGSKLASRNVPESAVKDPKIIGRAVGMLMATIGKSALRGRAAVASGILTILWIVAKSAATSLPGAMKITWEREKQRAQQLIGSFRNMGVTISDGEAQKIIQEVFKEGPRIQIYLEQLKEAFEALQSS